MRSYRFPLALQISCVALLYRKVGQACAEIFKRDGCDSTGHTGASVELPNREEESNFAAFCIYGRVALVN